MENVGAEFRLEGVELEEVSELPLEEAEVSEQSLEEAEVSEQPLEGVSDEVLGWKECAVVLGVAGRGSE